MCNRLALHVCSLLIVLLGTGLDVEAGRRRGPAPSPLLAPEPGAPEYQQLAMVSVPGGVVNAAGGNFQTGFTVLSLDTRLGSYDIGIVYNSKGASWLWSFDVTYDGATFLDPTGASHDVTSLPPGSAIPGTSWVVVDGTRIKTKGGLLHEFDAQGRLAVIRWTSSDYPRLVFQSQQIGSAWRTTDIDQCRAPGDCEDIYDLTYSGSGDLLAITDRAGRAASFDYDPSRRLVAARDGLDTAKDWPGLRYEYSVGTLTAITNSEGERIEIEYAGPRVRRVRPIGEENPVYEFEYKPASEGLYRTVVTDPLGNKTRIRYDAARRVYQILNPVDDLTLFEWSDKRIVQQVLPDGVTTSWSYVDDDVATEVQATGNVVAFSYEPNGVNRGAPRARPVREIRDSLNDPADPDDFIVRYDYDMQGRLVSVTKGAGETTSYAYDAEGMIETITGPAGVETDLDSYGWHGRFEEIDRGGLDLAYLYDGVGNLLDGNDVSSPSGPGRPGIASRGFDADRNAATLLLQPSDPANCYSGCYSGESYSDEELSIERRSDGRIASIARPFGADAEFVYDALGRMVERRDKASGVPDGEGGFHAAWQSTAFERDALGRSTAVERPNGMREEWDYDPAGRVAEHRIVRSGQLESSVQYTYQDGRLVSLLDSVHGAPETYAYDETTGELTQIVFPDGETMLFDYDLRSRRTLVQYWLPGSVFLRQLSFTYDAADREIRVEDGSELVLGRTFLDGRLSEVAYGNGLVRSFTYDGATGSLVGSSTENAQGGLVESSENAEHPWNVYSAQAWSTTTYGNEEVTTVENVSFDAPEDILDKHGRRLVSESMVQGTGFIFHRQYHYDPLGNLTAKLESDDPGDISVQHGTHFVYDTERNRLLYSETLFGTPSVHDYVYDKAGFVIERDGIVWSWDGAGRVTAVGSDATFSWDTHGRPVSFVIAGQEKRWRFGGALEADSAGNPATLDLGFAKIDLGTNERLYRHHDYRGNVKFVTSDQGEVVTHYRYWGYDLDEIHGSDEDDRRFAGGQHVDGIVVLGHRPYDQDAGRFLAPDPVYQLVNQFTYTLGNPIHFWDPDGQMEAILDADVIGSGGGGGLSKGPLITAGTGPVPGMMADLSTPGNVMDFMLQTWVENGTLSQFLDRHHNRDGSPESGVPDVGDLGHQGVDDQIHAISRTFWVVSDCSAGGQHTIHTYYVLIGPLFWRYRRLIRD